MKRNKITILTIFILTLFLYNKIQAQNIEIHITGQNIYMQDDKLHIDLTFSSEKVNNNYCIELIPIMYNDTYEHLLPPARIAGRRYLISRERKSMSSPSRYSGDENVIWQTVASGDTLYYSAIIDYKPWMKMANIRVDRALVGPGSSEVLSPIFVFDHFRLAQPKVAPTASSSSSTSLSYSSSSANTYSTPFPPPNQSEARAKAFIGASSVVENKVIVSNENQYYLNKDALWLYFRKNEDIIDVNYLANVEVLNQIESTLKKMLIDGENANYKILIVSYTSIDSSFIANQNMAERRSNLMRDLIVNYGISPNRVEIVNIGEAWDILRSLLVASAIPNKKEILYIIDRVPIMKGREKQLMDLNGGIPYIWMKKNLFPELNKTGFIKVF